MVRGTGFGRPTRWQWVAAVAILFVVGAGYLARQLVQCNSQLEDEVVQLRRQMDDLLWEVDQSDQASAAVLG